MKAVLFRSICSSGAKKDLEALLPGGLFYPKIARSNPSPKQLSDFFNKNNKTALYF